MIPDADEARALLDQAGCAPDVRAHVEAVARLAIEMARLSDEADAALVLAGALLHDVGRAFDHGPAHLPLGAQWLRDHDVDERVVRCIERHMGAGISATEANAFGWPEGTYAPETIEQRIVCHADNLTVGTSHVHLADVRARFERRRLADAVARLEALHRTLSDELGIDPDRVVDAIAARD